MGRSVLGCCALASALLGEPAWGAWTMHSPAPSVGLDESCKQDSATVDAATDCENCRDLELVSCDIYLGDETMGNKAVFTVKNHNSKYPRLSRSARFGHVGDAPGSGTAAAPGVPPPAWATSTSVTAATSASTSTAAGGGYDVAPPVSLEIPSAATPHYQGKIEITPLPPSGAYSESMPDAFTVNPNETKTFEFDSITDFPAISQCQDIVYMAVDQQGVPETPTLWNRGHACTILPCPELGFRRCTVHRGGGGAKTP